MAHPYHHALSSAKKWHTQWETHFPLHDWLDSSKFAFSDARHRSLFHNKSGVNLSKQIFKDYHNPEEIATHHITEDIGFVPNIQNWIPEEFWSKDLQINKNIDLVNVKDCLLFNNHFPKQTQPQLAEIIDFLLYPERTEELKETSPLRFFFFSSCGPFICERILGPTLKGSIPTRSATEYFIQKVWDKIPSHQDIMSKSPIEDWMWKKAKPLSKTL